MLTILNRSRISCKYKDFRICIPSSLSICPTLLDSSYKRNSLSTHLFQHWIPFPRPSISHNSTVIMARIQIPLDVITSRLNLSDRFAGVRSQSIAARFANLKPISEFLDLKRLSKPANFSEVQSRVNYNLGHFSSNYAVVFVMLSIYALLTRPLLLFVIFLVVGGMWGIGKLDGRDLDVGFVRATSSQLYTALLVVAVPLGFFASPVTTILWLIGASGVTILGHASFMDKPIDEAFSGEAV